MFLLNHGNTHIDPAVIQQLKKIGVEPSYAGAEDFQKEISDSFKVYGDVMKKIGIAK